MTSIIAHRGASGYAPENTLAAFRRAVEIGAQFIETDLQISRDGHFVAIHDASLRRTTNGYGRVEDLTLSELKALDAGSWFAPAFAGERIPTLGEILEFAEQFGLTCCVEVKFGFEGSALARLLEQLQGSGRLAQCILLCFDARVLAEARRRQPALACGLLLDRLPADPIDAAKQIGAQYVGPRQDLVTRELVQRAHLADLRVATWTVNDVGRMRELVMAGIDGVVTNYPDRLAAMIGSVSPEK